MFQQSGRESGNGQFSRRQLTDVVCLFGNEPSFQADHLDGIQTDLEDVVYESQQRCQGERRHEEGGEAELDHYRRGTPRDGHKN